VAEFVGIDRAADPGRLHSDQLGSSVQQPQQPGRQVGRDDAGQSDELATGNYLAAAQL
jgi:hypothetical protein